MGVRQMLAQGAQAFEQRAAFRRGGPRPIRRGTVAGACGARRAHAFWFYRCRDVYGQFLAQHQPALRIERQHRIAILSFLDEPLMEQGTGDAAPFVDRSPFAYAVDAQRIMPARKHALGARAAQDVDDLGSPEALSALRQARDAGHELPGLHAPVLQRSRLATVVAGAARTRESLAEVAQLDRSAAFGRLGITQHLTQLLARYALFVLEGRARIRIDLLLNQEFRRADIGGAEVKCAARGVPVTSGAAGLLIVAFQSLRQIVVHDPTHIGLVDAHPEGGGCDDHLDIVANEGFLIVAPDCGIESGVIRAYPDSIDALPICCASSSTRRRDRQ